MSVGLGANKKCSLEELVRVATGCQSVALIGSEKPTTKVSMVRDAEASLRCETGELCVARSLARAAVMSRVHSLAQGRSTCSIVKVLELLVATLNLNIVPAFTSYDKSDDELVAFIEGRGQCYASDKNELCSTAASFENASITSIQLSEEDSAILRSHPFLIIGTGCMLAAAAVGITRVVDCVTALSCEAAGSGVDAFDSANFEVNRPHRGLMLSASNLRLLLDGSKRINACPKDQKSSLVKLQNAPQTTGPCRDIIIAAAKAMEIELNSFEAIPSNSKNGIEFNGTQAGLIAQNLCNALDILVRSSAERTAVVCSITKCTNSTEPIAGLDAYSDVHSRYRLVRDLTGRLGQEILSANLALNAIEANEAAAYLTKLELADKNKSGGGEEGGKSKGKPEVVDDSGLTPEQRARAEAKRKEKAEKAAAKAAAKEQKKASGGAAVALGAGSTLIRQYIVNGCQGELTTDRLKELLYPFDCREDNFSSFCTKVLEQLNSGGKFKPKIAKGARDFGPEQMRIREQAFSAIRRVFKRHGGVEIDTPVFELKELLTGKYGEDSKLIYDLADQGGELLSLRYDLTVPFARFLAMRSVGNIKRYHIAKVYRRDQPQAARGRYREFYQCDFDIAGSFSPMVPDAEVITVATEILSDLPIGQFQIKLNHRKLLDAIFEICGVPVDKFRPICSAVDKLDKMSWEEVKKEMVEEKGLAPESADKIANFVLHSGSPKELWQKFTDMKLFGDHEQANIAMSELKILFDYLDAMGSLQYVSFDMSLARGLDYYTGVIYEAVLINGAVAVGSIAAGGRYDNLVGMFSPAGVQTPCVGVSIGVERVFAIMEKKAEELNIMQNTGIQVYIASIGANLIAERMKVAQMLWKANISAEYPHQDNPKFKKQLDDALERGIPFMVVFGSEELARGIVKVKDMRNHTEVEVSRDQLVAMLMQQGCFAVGSGADSDFLEALKSSSATDAQPETA